MKKGLGVLLLSLPVMASAQNYYAQNRAPASATQGYIEVSAGMVIPQDATLREPGIKANISFDDGYFFAGRLGEKLHGGWQVEGELAYRDADMDRLTLKQGFGSLNGRSGSADGEINILSGMGNLIYNIPTHSRINPYIGAGIGLARVEAKFSDDTESDSVFAYQGIVGLRFNLDQDLDVVIDYRYFATADPDFDSTKAEVNTSNVGIGIRFGF